MQTQDYSSYISAYFIRKFSLLLIFKKTISVDNYNFIYFNCEATTMSFFLFILYKELTFHLDIQSFAKIFDILFFCFIFSSLQDFQLNLNITSSRLFKDVLLSLINL
jgi:hypothetical protein